MMRRILITAGLFCNSLFAGRFVSEVAFTGSTHSIHGFSSKGDVTLAVRSFQVDVQYPDGERERGDVFVIYDPESGHYAYLFAEVRAAVPGSFLTQLESGNFGIYAGEDKLVEFVVQSDLDIQEGAARAANLDGACAAAVEEMESRVLKKTDRLHNDVIVTPLYQAVGGEFACPQHGEGDYSPMCSFHAKKISSITRQGENWRLVIENRWDQEL